jgi:hypothetical protein
MGSLMMSQWVSVDSLFRFATRVIASNNRLLVLLLLPRLIS